MSLEAPDEGRTNHFCTLLADKHQPHPTYDGRDDADIHIFFDTHFFDEVLMRCGGQDLDVFLNPAQGAAVARWCFPACAMERIDLFTKQDDDEDDPWGTCLVGGLGRARRAIRETAQPTLSHLGRRRRSSSTSERSGGGPSDSSARAIGTVIRCLPRRAIRETEQPTTKHLRTISRAAGRTLVVMTRCRPLVCLESISIGPP